MAIWTFRIHLVPAKSLLNTHGKIPATLEQYMPSKNPGQLLGPDETFINYWSSKSALRSIKEVVEGELPETHSWSSDATMYSRDGEITIEIWEDDVVCSIDARSKKIAELIELVDLISEKTETTFILSENGQVVPREPFCLENAFKKSKAYKFTINPIDTLLQAAHNNNH